MIRGIDNMLGFNVGWAKIPEEILDNKNVMNSFLSELNRSFIMINNLFKFYDHKTARLTIESLKRPESK